MTHPARFLLPSILLGCALAGCEARVEETAAASQVETLVPAIVIEPAALDFGDVAVGASATLELRVANEGDAALVTTLALAGENPAFSLDTAEVELEPGVGQRVNVTFTPAEVGSVGVALTLTSNDPVNGIMLVPITGAGLGPQLEPKADPLGLGEAELRCPVSGTVLVRNAGTLPVTIDAFTFADPMFTAAAGAVTVPPDGFAAIDVTATPLMLGESVGTLVAETTQGAIYAGSVSVTGVPRSVYTETYVVQPASADVLVVLDATLPDGIAGVRAQVEALLPLAAGEHRLAVTVADDGCVPGAWIDASTADPLFALSEMLDAEPGTLPDQGFVRTFNALSVEALASGGCNEGFLRDDSALFVIGITDQHEESSVSFVTFVDTLAALKARPEFRVVNTVGGDWPGGCESITAAASWYEATLGTDGLYLSFCASDWSSALVDDVEDRYEPTSRFELSAFPDPSTLHVYVDGTEVTVGWTYHPVDNQVQFGDALPVGTEVEITYELEACPLP